jgi:BlaI family penicillinase repressor
MTKSPAISDAEWDVMEVLWNQSPLMAQQVIELVAEKKNWNPRTVKTLLGRLVKKKVLKFKADGNRYSYWPIVSREDCVRRESRSFVSRVFGGSVGPMLAHFVSESTLTEKEIRQLRELLDQRTGRGQS